MDLSLQIPEEPLMLLKDFFQIFPDEESCIDYFRAVQNQYMLFWLLKDAYLTCKRRPLRPLLTPF